MTATPRRDPRRDITAFLDALLFNFLIGNHDAHSKNYSLPLDGPDSIRLAPLYDLLSTSAIPGTSRKLAMKYGGENRPGYLRHRHLERLADELEVKPALVWSRAGAMWAQLFESIDAARRMLPTEFQAKPAIDEIVALIEERCERLGTLSQE